MKSKDYLNRFISLLMPVVIILLLNKFLIVKDYSFDKSLIQFLIITSVFSLVGGFVFSILYAVVLIFLLIFSFHSTIFNSLPSKEVIFTILDSNSSEGLSFIYSYLNISILFILLICIFSIFLRRKFLFFKGPKKYIFILPLIAIISSPLIFNKKNNLKTTFGFIYHFNDYLVEIENLNKLVMNPKMLTVENLEESIQPEKVFIVLGESLSKHHMSLYGYHRDTNPLLKKENLLKFENAISPNAFTNESIKKILSFSSHQNLDGIFKNGDLIDIAHAADYQTIWISNQSVFGSNDSSSAYFAKKSKIRYYTLKQYGLDEQVIPLLKKALIPNKKQVFIIHLIGSHFLYSSRYPSDFNTFKGSSNREVDQYDNSVLYNDLVVSKLLAIAKEQTLSSFVYLSDHGEEVFDFRNFRGHAEEIATHFMFDIPYLFWFSDELKMNSSNSKRNVQTQDFIHAFQSIIKRKTIYYDDSRDIFSNNFKEDKIIPMGKIQYTKDLSRFQKKIITDTKILHKLKNPISNNICTSESLACELSIQSTDELSNFYKLSYNPNTIFILTLKSVSCNELLTFFNNRPMNNNTVLRLKDFKCLDELSKKGMITSWIIPEDDISTTRKRMNFSIYLNDILSKYSISYLSSPLEYYSFLRDNVSTKPLMTTESSSTIIDPMVHFIFKKQ